MAEIAGDEGSRLQAEEVRQSVAASLNRGDPAAEVGAMLVQQGWPEDVAQAFVAQVESDEKARRAGEMAQLDALQSKQNRRDAALWSMKVGAGWLIGGLLITGITYMAAENGGGHYVVTYGAIIYGAFRFLGGLIQYAQP